MELLNVENNGAELFPDQFDLNDIYSSVASSPPSSIASTCLFDSANNFMIQNSPLTDAPSSVMTCNQYNVNNSSPSSDSLGSVDDPNHTLVPDFMLGNDWNVDFVDSMQHNQILVDNESDSGLSSMSASNSPKTAQHFILPDSNQNYSSDSGDNGQLLSNEILNEYMSDDVEDTEKLLNSIEQLLKSMQDSPDIIDTTPAEAKKVTTSHALKLKSASRQQKLNELNKLLKCQQQLIKQEPSDCSYGESSSSTSFRKISPKPLNAPPPQQHQQQQQPAVKLQAKPANSNNQNSIAPNIMSVSNNNNNSTSSGGVIQAPIQIATIPVHSFNSMPVILQRPSNQIAGDPKQPTTIIINNPPLNVVPNGSSSILEPKINFKPIAIKSSLPPSNSNATQMPILIAAPS